MTRRKFLEFSGGLIALALVAACGRKGPLTPPDQIDPDDPDDYLLWPEDDNVNDGSTSDSVNDVSEDEKVNQTSEDEPWPMDVDRDDTTETAP